MNAFNVKYIKWLFFILILIAVPLLWFTRIRPAAPDKHTEYKKAGILAELWVANSVFKENPDSALLIAGKVLRESRKEKNDILYGLGLIMVSKSLIEKNEKDSGLAVVERAQQYAYSSSDTSLVILFHEHSGRAYLSVNRVINSILSYLKALFLIREQNYASALRDRAVFINLGDMLYRFGEKKLSRQISNEALVNMPPDSGVIAYLWTNLGLTYDSAGDKRALLYFTGAYDKAVDFKDENLVYDNLLNLCDYYIRNEDFREAGRYLDKIRQHPYKRTFDLEYRYGGLYYKMKQYDEALKHFLIIDSSIRTGDYHEYLYGPYVYKSIEDIYKAKGDLAMALYYERKYSDVELETSTKGRKRIFDLVYSLSYSEKERGMQNQQKQLLIEKQKLKEKNQVITLIIFSFFFIVLLFLIWYRLSLNRQKLQELQLQKINRELDIIRLTALVTGEEKERTRIAQELHDGIMVRFLQLRARMKSFGSVYIDKGSVDIYNDLIDQFDYLGVQLRQTAHNLLHEILSGENLLEVVTYFGQEVEGAHGISVKVNLVGQSLTSLNLDFQKAIYKIIQELVQNIIKHAQAQQIIIQFSYSETLFSTTVEDNGTGFKPGNSKGVGLKMVKSRVAAFSGTMDIMTNIESGTSVYIEFRTADVQYDDFKLL